MAIGIISALQLIIFSFPVGGEEGKRLSLTSEQKNALEKAQNWTIKASHDYGKADKYGGIPIEKDCSRILEYSGWAVKAFDSSAHDVLLEKSVEGTPRGCSYTNGTHYTGTGIAIEASVKLPEKNGSFHFPNPTHL